MRGARWPQRDRPDVRRAERTGHRLDDLARRAPEEPEPRSPPRRRARRVRRGAHPGRALREARRHLRVEPRSSERPDARDAAARFAARAARGAGHLRTLARHRVLRQRLGIAGDARRLHARLRWTRRKRLAARRRHAGVEGREASAQHGGAEDRTGATRGAAHQADRRGRGVGERQARLAEPRPRTRIPEGPYRRGFLRTVAPRARPLAAALRTPPLVLPPLRPIRE